MDQYLRSKNETLHWLLDIWFGVLKNTPSLLFFFTDFTLINMANLYLIRKKKT